ncbi:MAG: acetolactate synthase small subunit [Pseudomonadota bacterium]|jgi:acetolactate synthase-1/3 small subunit|nr:acetolactate synthase small subunit [Pseudomonadota bacterium]|tara:strand:- start:1504 stop:1983 length:480 start_codon:yes stop_codon:yes gene_type:complete
MKRVVALLMENQPGALSRVVGLFSQRGYNIESLIVAPTDDPSLSRLTMVTEGDAKAVEQITKQLNKLIDVVKVVDLSEEEFIGRELLLIKLRATKDLKAKIEDSRGEIVFESEEIINVQFVGSSDEVDVFLSSLSKDEILEIARSGLSGVSASEKLLTI